ncbi:hypothetical protein DNTS_010865 [Danionella cerebrum]|uniref:Glypican-5 n=1 Tax=Danionella cerebrum TaxID=2873325 RepID=A0A553Q4N4_9TELE|nr:hypothetical protein DNTS_010865 [Danionella translucida]
MPGWTALRVRWPWLLLSGALLPLLSTGLEDMSSSNARSCQEVKTAFHLRQVGLLRLVPETEATDADLLICKQQGPTCCTRKMEESYYTAAQRETLHNILSYSFELKFLILGHASSFQNTFHSLISFTQNHTFSLFDSTYETIAQDAKPLVSAFFNDLDLYLRGDANIDVEQSVHRFYDKLFPLVYQHLVNPGLGSPSTWSSEGTECLRATRHDINPFGPHPRALAHVLSKALIGGRALTRALAVGAEVLNVTDSVGLTRQCGRVLVRMLFCPHCRRLTLIRPCRGLCLNVMRGCLAGLGELDRPWRRYVEFLAGLSGALAGGYEVELALLRIREKINDAILTAQLNGPHLSAVPDVLHANSPLDKDGSHEPHGPFPKPNVGKVCGSLTESVSSTPVNYTLISSTSPMKSTIEPKTSVSSSAPTAPPDSESPHEHPTLRRRSLPLKPSKNDKPRSLKKISKEFMGYIQRYKSFFSTLPEMLCEGEVVMDENTCWSGEDEVERS